MKGKKGFQRGHPDYISSETRKIAGMKISKAKIGHKHSEESKKKMSKSAKGRKPPKTAFKKGLNGELSGHWKGGLPKCIDCGKQLTNYKTKRCSECNGKHNRGENHPLWKGGISRDIHSLNEPRYKKWRTAVFARDNWKCRISNKDCSDCLQAHHILPWRDYPELRYNINNGITLCQAHHPRKRAEEKRLIPFFQGLVSVSN